MNRHLFLSCIIWLALSGSAVQAASGGEQVCVEIPPSQMPVCAHEFNPDAAQTVVLIHGIHGDPLAVWSGQIPFLSHRYHVLSLQLSGFYRLSEDASADGVGALTRALDHLVQRHAKGPVILLAHSMGGVIGLRYAIDYPGKVQQMVLVDVSGVLQRIAFTRSLVKNRISPDGEGDLFTRLVGKLATKFLVEMDGYSTEIAAQHQPQGDEIGYLSDKPELLAAFQLIEEDFSESISTVRLPVLIVWGEIDRIAPLRIAYALAARLPSSQLLIIPQAGHMAMREKSDVFNRAMDDFLSQSPVLQRPDVVYPHDDLPTLREVDCRSENGQVFTGYYRRITLNGCDRAVIRNARVGELVVIGSRLEILHSHLGGGAFGLSTIGSEIEITASRLEGDVALVASRSRVDMAAVELIGHTTSVQGKRGSDLLFSLSTVRSPMRQGPIHGYFTVDRNNSL